MCPNLAQFTHKQHWSMTASILWPLRLCPAHVALYAWVNPAQYWKYIYENMKSCACLTSSCTRILMHGGEKQTTYMGTNKSQTETLNKD